MCGGCTAVLGSVLKGLGPNALQAAAGPPRVARVTVLGADGTQQTYDGVLVGADKSRDLAVVRRGEGQRFAALLSQLPGKGHCFQVGSWLRLHAAGACI